ncbi:hypothetical protein BKK81_05630 [Cupriavidus sp. USMAHM13]|uniref:Chalcone isomerase domain-containing protein n=1 Tax=Cupriavidus malaysiensis TaxID=367825 RepID=A0ABN4TEL7_9BURK|nr:hypothetical protein BKK81_05630 [Cupriavidus sp. USMAHM13]AOZ05238.1 hypothetical protein BKK80_04935 [Cupriavidus malaysiensis]
MPSGSTLPKPLRASRRQLAARCAAAALLCLAASGASAGMIAGLRLDDAARVGGRTLQLNGAGLRAGFLDKGYVAALYLPEKVRNATMVLGGSGPKRLQIRPLREVEPDTFIKALDKGLRINLSESQRQQIHDRLTQFGLTMNLIGTAHKGDVIDIDFTPDTGMVVAINGTPRGRPIPGEDFYQAVLRTYLGNNPVDRELKRGLLGG